MNVSPLINKIKDLGIHLVIENGMIRLLGQQNKLTSELAEQIKGLKTEIIEYYTDENHTDSPIINDIKPDQENANLPFPLTDIQQAYWVGRRGDFELGNIATHSYFEFDCKQLNLEGFNIALQKLIDYHSMLKCIIQKDGQQRILAEVPKYEVELMDLSSLTNEEAQKVLLTERERMSHRVFKTDQWPLFEFKAFQLDKNHTQLHLVFEVIIIDAMSFRIMMKDLQAFYENPQIVLPKKEISFRDYVIWENSYRETVAYQESIAFWDKKIPSIPPAPELTLNKNPDSIQNPKYSHFRDTLNKTKWSRIKELAMNFGLSPSGVLMTAFSDVLNTWSKSSQFTLNLTVFNRPPKHPDIDELIGDFTTLTLLPLDYSQATTFLERASKNQQEVWENLDHIQVSNLHILRKLGRIHERISGAVFPVVFTSMLMNDLDIASSSRWLGDTAFQSTQTSQVWLDNHIHEKDGVLYYNWDYVEGLFPTNYLEEMFNAHRRLLDKLAEDESFWTSTDTFSLLSEKQLHNIQVLNPEPAEPAYECLHQLFEKRTYQQPENLAVVCAKRTFTYKELNCFVNCVAKKIPHPSSAHSNVVAVIMQKGWEQVVAVLAILKSGNAYLPIDPELPAQRIEFLLENSQAHTVLIQPNLRRTIQYQESLSVVVVDESIDQQEQSTENNFLGNSDDMAYIIYTSGSTGTPKGVMVDHKSAVNIVLDINEKFSVSSNDRVLAISSLSFDLSVYDLFGSLAAGSVIVIPEPDDISNPESLLDLMKKEDITIWNSVPALMEMLLEYVQTTNDALPDALRLVLISGDWIPTWLPAQMKAMRNEIQLISLGGATEASIWSIFHPIDHVDASWKSIPYGKSMKNQQMYILDEQLNFAPEWVPGQIYIGGLGLAMGYWKDIEKTDNSFVIHPNSGKRLYKTGDIGRLLPTGDIEFLGREDSQVKIRGFRIELGEIEAVLKDYPDTNDVVTTVKPDSKGNKHLVAYWTSQTEVESTKSKATVVGYEQFSEEGVQIVSSVERLEFKLKRFKDMTSGHETHAIVMFDDNFEEPRLTSRFSQRMSYRKFKQDIIDFKRFSQFFSNLQLYNFEGVPFPRYQYGSAGGLYPVQTYIYVKEDRVQKVPAGIYFYHPVRNCLITIDATVRFDSSIVTMGNDCIFEEAAFAVFLVADMDAIEPMYGTTAYDFCMLEAGLITQHLEANAFKNEVGLCQIGGFNFDSIRDKFCLQKNDRYLHCLFGGKIEQDENWTFLDEMQQTTNPKRNDLKKANEDDIRRFLKEKLAAYMVPEFLVQVDHIPLTSNGKVDQKSLPNPLAQRLKLQSKEPETPLEKQIAAIFCEILSIEICSLDDNFFELGGDSLLAIQLTTQIKSNFKIDFSLKDFFDHASVYRLAVFIKDADKVLSIGEKDNEKPVTIVPDLENRFEPFPLTDIQQAYWIGRTGEFNLGNISTHSYMEIENSLEQLDTIRLNQAWQKLVEHHEMLRTVFLPDGRQQILKTVPFYKFKILDVRGKPQKEQDFAIKKIRREMSHQVISADQWPLFDIRLTFFRNNNLLLHISLDALTIDAWSVFRLFDDWIAFYEKPDLNLTPFELSFRDYVLAEKELEQGDVFRRDRAYWIKRLQNLPSAPELPLIKNPGSIEKPFFSRCSTILEREIWDQLKLQAKENRITATILLLSAFTEVIRYWSKSSDFTINLTVFNRLPLHHEVNNIIGDFTSLILLGVKSNSSNSLKQKALQLQKQLWQDMDHRYFSGIKVVREIARRKQDLNNASMPVVFTSALNLDSNETDAGVLDYFGKMIESISQTPQVWLDCQVYEHNGALVINWDYIAELFPKNMIEDMFSANCRLLKTLVRQPETWNKIRFDLLPDDQIKRRLDYNRTSTQIPD